MICARIFAFSRAYLEAHRFGVPWPALSARDRMKRRLSARLCPRAFFPCKSRRSTNVRMYWVVTVTL